MAKGGISEKGRLPEVQMIISGLFCAGSPPISACTMFIPCAAESRPTACLGYCGIIPSSVRPAGSRSLGASSVSGWCFGTRVGGGSSRSAICVSIACTPALRFEPLCSGLSRPQTHVAEERPCGEPPVRRERSRGTCEDGERVHRPGERREPFAELRGARDKPH